MKIQQDQTSRMKEWQQKLMFFTSGLLFFETLTGLCIYLLPFSVSNQIMVLLHTIIGLIFIFPFAWYQIRHWRVYQQTKMYHIKLTGYFSLLATMVACVSGLVLTYQAVFKNKISYDWDLVHIISTLALIVSLLPHIFVILVRDFRMCKTEILQPVVAAQKQYGLSQLLIVGALFAVVALLVYAYEPVQRAIG
jgi:hypothetical protein